MDSSTTQTAQKIYSAGRAKWVSELEPNSMWSFTHEYKINKRRIKKENTIALSISILRLQFTDFVNIKQRRYYSWNWIPFRNVCLYFNIASREQQISTTALAEVPRITGLRNSPLSTLLSLFHLCAASSFILICTPPLQETQRKALE